MYGNRKAPSPYKKIIGQLNAIDRMIDDETIPCENVLMQVNAAKSALHSVGKVILEGHLKHCVIDGIQHGDAEKQLKNLLKPLTIFLDFHKKAIDFHQSPFLLLEHLFFFR